MGCHTWFYQKSSLTKAEAKERAIAYCDKNIEISVEDFIDMEIENAEEKKIENEAFWKRVKRMLEKDILNPFKLQHRHNDFFCEKGYYMDNKIAHDIFRVDNYPEDLFFSFEELETWLNKNKVELTKEQWEKLKDYWKQYPDSLVRFG